MRCSIGPNSKGDQMIQHRLDSCCCRTLGCCGWPSTTFAIRRFSDSPSSTGVSLLGCPCPHADLDRVPAVVFARPRRLASWGAGHTSPPFGDEVCCVRHGADVARCGKCCYTSAVLRQIARHDDLGGRGPQCRRLRPRRHQAAPPPEPRREEFAATSEPVSFFLVPHPALPDLQRMKLLLFWAASSAPRSVFSWCE